MFIFWIFFLWFVISDIITYNQRSIIMDRIIDHNRMPMIDDAENLWDEFMNVSYIKHFIKIFLFKNPYVLYSKKIQLLSGHSIK